MRGAILVPMALTAYRRVLALPGVRNALLLGFAMRLPQFAVAVVLTLHVVEYLGRSWAQAGLAAAVGTVCIAISGPWRGLLLDRWGLRRVVLPSLVVLLVCWSIAPFSSYWVLLALAGVAGLFAIPTFSVVRQAVIAAVDDEDRRTALSLDSVVVESAFVLGPVVAIWMTAWVSTAWVLFGVQMLGVVAGVVLWVLNPPLVSAERVSASAALRTGVPARREWFTPGFLALCATATATLVVLVGSDVAVVAAVTAWGEVPRLGVVLALWGLGSIIGALVYGALPRPLPPFALLGALSLATIPLGLAPGLWSLALLSFVAGLVTAPTITATVDAISRVVPELARGEAMGWHGSFMTTGAALGAPLAGAAIDRWGHTGGFLSVAAVGLAMAVLAWGDAGLRRRGQRLRASEQLAA